MHDKSPDSFARDLARAERIERARGRPRDASLAADWAVKRELRALAGEPLPERVRAAAVRATRPSHRPPWLVAAAAALMIAVAAAVVLQAPAPPAATPSRDDLAELGLALSSLERAGRRAVALAGREVSTSLRRPDLGLAELPYAQWVRSALQPAPEPSETPPQEKEQR
jgi:hypothetical protein